MLHVPPEAVSVFNASAGPDALSSVEVRNLEQITDDSSFFLEDRDLKANAM